MKKQRLDLLEVSVLDRLIALIKNGQTLEIEEIDKILYRLTTTLITGKKKKDLIIELALRNDFWEIVLANVPKHRELIAYVFQSISLFDLSVDVQTQLRSVLGIVTLKPSMSQYPLNSPDTEVAHSCEDMDIIYAKSTQRRFAPNNFIGTHLDGYSHTNFESAYYEIVFYADLEGMICGKVNGNQAFLCTQSFVTPLGDCFIYGVNYRIDDSISIELNDIDKRLGKLMYYYEDILELCKLISKTPDSQVAFYLLTSINDKLKIMLSISANAAVHRELRECANKLKAFLEAFSNENTVKRTASILKMVESSVKKHLVDVVNYIKSDAGIEVSIDTESKRIIVHSLPDQLQWKVTRQVKTYNSKKGQHEPIGDITLDLNDPRLGVANKTTGLKMLDLKEAIADGIITPDVFEP